MRARFMAFLVTAIWLMLPQSIGGATKSGELFVLATLYGRHKTVTAYDLPALRKIILTIKPDVLVLDVTPMELKEGKVWPGKIEYTEVVFPLIKDGSYRVYPAEPDEPMFSEIVNATTEAIRKFEAATPETATAMKQFTVSAYDALKSYWKTPAEVNSHVTDRVLHGKKTLEAQLQGIVRADGQKRWNQHTVDVTRRAVKENQGKRVLILVGIENCYSIRELLGRDPQINLVNMERWLRDKGL
jgi:hypothetical protein